MGFQLRYAAESRAPIVSVSNYGVIFPAVKGKPARKVSIKFKIHHTAQFLKVFRRNSRKHFSSKERQSTLSSLRICKEQRFKWSYIKVLLLASILVEPHYHSFWVLLHWRALSKDRSGGLDCLQCTEAGWECDPLKNETREWRPVRRPESHKKPAFQMSQLTLIEINHNSAFGGSLTNSCSQGSLYLWPGAWPWTAEKVHLTSKFTVWTMTCST